MRPNTLKLLLSTTSLAALAALAGTAVVDKAAWAADEVITSNSTTQRTLGTFGDDLTVTNGAELHVSTGTAVIMNNHDTSLTVGLISGSFPNVGPGTVTGEGQLAVQVNAFTGLNILVNTNGSIRADAATNNHTINVIAGAGLTIDNHGVISNLSTTAANAAINIAGSASVTINNTLLNPGDPPPAINADSGAAINIGSVVAVTGAINNDGVIISGHKNSYGGGTIHLGAGASISGGINNSSTGVIQADLGGTGVFFDNASSSNISNAGTIAQVNGGTDAQAIFFLDDATSNITNSGTISASGTGTESGAIVFNDTGGPAADVTGSINNLSGGRIVATGQGASAISFENFTSLTGGISNAGTIEVTDATADDVGVAIKIGKITGSSLSITNFSGGIIRGTGKTGGAILSDRPSETVIIDNRAGALITTSTSQVAANTIHITNASDSSTLISNAGTISNTGSATNTILVDAGASFTLSNLSGGLISGGGGSVHTVRVDTGVGSIINGTGATITGAGSGSTLRIASGGMTGLINNFGTIENTSGERAINANGTVTGGIHNKAGGIIQSTGSEAAEINQNVFTQYGGQTTGVGQINGNLTGANAAIVNFNLDAVTLETLPGDGGFNPATDPFGFVTNGNTTLALGATSQINVNTGSVFVSAGDTWQAEDVLNAAGAVMGLGNGATVIVGDTTYTNNGLLFVGGGDTAEIQGKAVSEGVGNMVGFGLIHPTSSTASYGRLDVNAGPGTEPGTMSFDANTTVRIYNDFKGYTPATGTGVNSGIILIDTFAGAGMSINGSTASGTLAKMDTAYNDTLTLQFVAKISDVITDPQSETNNLDLFVIRTGFGDIAGLTPNQRRAGNALEDIGFFSDGSDDLNAFLGLLDSITSTGQMADALQKTLPIANGAALYGTMIGFDSVLQSIDTRLANFQGQYVDAGKTGMSGAAGGRFNGVWIRGGAGAGWQDTQNGPGGPVAGWDGRTYYGVIGADREIREGLRVGATFSYADSKFDGNGDDVGDSRLKIKSYQGSLYGAWESMGWWASGIVGGGVSNYEGKRTIDISTPAGDFFDVKNSDYDGWQFTAKAMVGKVFGAETGFTIAPFATLRYSHIKIDQYTEEGVFEDALSLTVDSQNYDQLLPGVGVRIAAPLMGGGGMTFLPWVRATYQYDVIGDRQNTTSTFGGDLSGSNSFLTEGLRPGRGVFNVGGGLNVFSSGPITASLSADWEKRDGFSGVSGFGQIRVGF